MQTVLLTNIVVFPNIFLIMTHVEHNISESTRINGNYTQDI